VSVTVNGKLRMLNELLKYHPDLAKELHAKDRVHTYGSFYIADVAA
jgi:S-adenosylmethionine-diacylglycerol 3-amino-3-carboxypropyl transferase